MTSDRCFTARLLVDADLADAVTEALSHHDALPATAVAQFTASDGQQDVTAYYETRPDTAILQNIIQCAVPSSASLPEIELSVLEPENWVAKSQKSLHPVEGGRFIVHGSHDMDRFGTYRRAILIDAGQAFGTAHHGSTRGCLIALSNRLKQGLPFRMLDLGTGSGVLAIAAAKAGARDVVATDIDPIAVAVAQENAGLNDIASRVSFLQAKGLDHPVLRHADGFDLVLANILARPLATLAPDIANVLVNGGDLILSGLIPDQARAIAARYRSMGFSLRRSSIVDGWSTLLLQRRSN